MHAISKHPVLYPNMSRLWRRGRLIIPSRVYASAISLHPVPSHCAISLRHLTAPSHCILCRTPTGAGCPGVTKCSMGAWPCLASGRPSSRKGACAQIPRGTASTAWDLGRSRRCVVAPKHYPRMPKILQSACQMGAAVRANALSIGPTCQRSWHEHRPYLPAVRANALSTSPTCQRSCNLGTSHAHDALHCEAGKRNSP